MPQTEFDFEYWKKIEGDYEISSTGRVRRIKTGVILRTSLVSGYSLITLRVNGERNSYLVHRLVAKAFLGDCPSGLEVDHIDGNRTNNMAENLRYVSRKKNVEYAMQRLGRWGQPYGEDNHRAKLSDAAVIEIRRLFLEGFTQKQLAEIYGVGQPQISRIVREKRRSKRLKQ